MRKHQAQTIVVGLWAFLLLLWSSMLSAEVTTELKTKVETEAETEVETDAETDAETERDFWNTSNESNPDKIDHSAWQAILDGYLKSSHPSGINRFDYANLKANTADKLKLKSYLLYLKRLDPRTYSKAEQKAYWINLYNALTIRIVVNEYRSVTSIKRVGDPFFGPWDKDLIKIQGKILTLNNIEQNILHSVWNDNRLYYATNSACLGCPNLASEAYTAANTEILLEKSAKDYVNHSRGVLCESNSKLLVSSLYQWYKADFGGTDEGVIKYLLKYAEPESDLASCLQDYKGPITHSYDWELNNP